jgi:hypothetical protein
MLFLVLAQAASNSPLRPSVRNFRSDRRSQRQRRIPQREARTGRALAQKVTTAYKLKLEFDRSIPTLSLGSEYERKHFPILQCARLSVPT